VRRKHRNSLGESDVSRSINLNELIFFRELQGFPGVQREWAGAVPPFFHQRASAISPALDRAHPSSVCSADEPHAAIRELLAEVVPEGSPIAPIVADAPPKGRRIYYGGTRPTGHCTFSSMGAWIGVTAPSMAAKADKAPANPSRFSFGTTAKPSTSGD
jgi:hypothetical protein